MKSRINVAACLLAALTVYAGPASAQTWKPAGPVTLVLPYGAGGGPDILGRPIARELESIWGQPVVVENIPGAESLIGTNKVINAPADGRTLLLNVQSMLLVKHLPGLKGTDPISNLDPVGLFASSPIVIVASKSTPGNNLQEVIAGCRRATPPCAMGGAGNLTKIGSKHFAQAANLSSLATVNYRSTPHMMTDLIGGSLALGFSALPGVATQGTADKFKFLAAATPKRISSLPDVPTTREAGLPDFEYQIWWGLFVRKGTPPAVTNDLALAVKRAVDQSSVQKAITGAGSEPIWAGPKEAARMIREDIRRYDALLKRHPLE